VTRRVVTLNDGQWRFGSVAQEPFGDVDDLGDGVDLVDVRDWMPAQVPGDVRLDLLRAGKIVDPYYGRNNEDSQWVDARDWWYTRDVNLALKPEERAFLVFEGIDYQSGVYFDGRPLGRHVGMFSRQVYELPVTAHSSPVTTPVQLAVRIWGSEALPKLHLTRFQKIWRRLIAPMFPPVVEPFPDRYATLKCQMQFGWDFAPRLRTCGIWDDASIVIARSVWIEDVKVQAGMNADRNTAHLAVKLALDSDRAQQVRGVVRVQGKNFQGAVETRTFDLELSSGKQVRELSIDVWDVRLWNPWDRGDPNLYEIQVDLFSANDEPLDSFATTYGIRSVELVTPPDEPRNAEPWTLVINGKREFIRGANWVPLDAMPGRLTREDYAARLRQVREANVNFLRVWGGGLREKRAFYDLCDELGILVWQEFPFAGAILDRFPNDRAFLELARAEATAIVHALRNHPSLAVWCGGNEFNTRGNRAIVQVLQSTVEHEDGTRPFKPASPSHDESHYWRVWHRMANLRDYRKDQTPFLSEFGLQSLPAIESLKRFLPAEALFPPNPLWVYHRAEVNKLERYARPMLNGQSARGVEEFSAATQRAQALGVQIAVEHMRRRKDLKADAGRGRAAAGVAVWQFDDPWPAISWSVVDYYGVPKRAYGELQRSYSPLLASFEYPGRQYRPGEMVSGQLWLINDWCRGFDDLELCAYLNDMQVFSRHVSTAPDSAARVDALQVQMNDGENLLRLELREGTSVLATNLYDLNLYDDGEIGPLATLGYGLYDRLMR
jgi:beta-mannosidase